MTEEEREEIRRFLAANWYDRNEKDEEIVAEVVALSTPEQAARTAEAITAVLDRDGAREELTALILDSTWLWFPDEVEAPIAWLRDVLAMLEAAITRR